MLSTILMLTSAAIMFFLGSVHLLFTFSGDRLTPRDPARQGLMQAGSPRLTRRTTMWKAWVGFNASHSLGAMLFGAFYAGLAVQHPALLMQSVFFGLLGLITLASYLALAVKYWFIRPLQGIALALVCYLAAFAVSL